MNVKTRPDAKIKLLPEDLQAEIAIRCQQPGQSWKVIRAWIKSEHGVDVRSDTALSDWLPWYHSRLRAREREQKIQGILDTEKRLNPGLTDAQLFSIGQRFFSELAVAEEDATTWAVVQRSESERLKREQKDREIQQREEALKLDREKFEFNAAESCLKHLPELRSIATKPGLSSNERIQEIRQRLFGVLPAAPAPA